MRGDTPLLGTWRLATYEVWNAAGGIDQPMGPSPAGYAVFDATGHAFIQLARGAGEDTSAVAASFVGYFGRYTMNEAGTEFTVTVEAANAPHYVGSLQVRPFKIDGDTLVLGIPGQYRATLHRVGV